MSFEVETLDTDAQRALAAIWAQTLSVPLDGIGKNSSFFQLGGDSVSAVKAVSRCRAAGFEITVAQIVSLQTIRKCAEILDSKQTPEATVWPTVIAR